MDQGNQQERFLPQQGAPVYGNPYQQQAQPFPQPGYQQPMVVQAMPQQQERPAGPTECRGKYPEQFFCTTCKRNLVSRVETSWGIGSCVWFLCCAPTLVLALLPCCVDGLRDVKHSCPICQRGVGTNPCLC